MDQPKNQRMKDRIIYFYVLPAIFLAGWIGSDLWDMTFTDEPLVEAPVEAPIDMHVYRDEGQVFLSHDQGQHLKLLGKGIQTFDAVIDVAANDTMILYVIPKKHTHFEGFNFSDTENETR